MHTQIMNNNSSVFSNIHDYAHLKFDGAIFGDDETIYFGRGNEIINTCSNGWLVSVNITTPHKIIEKTTNKTDKPTYKTTTKVTYRKLSNRIKSSTYLTNYINEKGTASLIEYGMEIDGIRYGWWHRTMSANPIFESKSYYDNGKVTRYELTPKSAIDPCLHYDNPDYAKKLLDEFVKQSSSTKRKNDNDTHNVDVDVEKSNTKKIKRSQ